MKNPEARHRSEDTTSSTDCLRLEYEEYLRNQRGLSERTIYHCWRLADRFLQFRFNGDSRDLSTISCDDIATFMQHLASGRKPFRDKTPPTHLRNFFRFLFNERKDQRQPRPRRTAYRAEICVQDAKIPCTRASGGQRHRSLSQQPSFAAPPMLHRRRPVPAEIFDSLNNGGGRIEMPATRASGKAAPSKIAVRWLDVVLAFLVICLGLSFWSGADRFTAWSRRDDKPVKESFEYANSVQLRRFELANVQKALDTVQAKLAEKTLEQTLLATEIAAAGKTSATKTSPPGGSRSQQQLTLSSVAAAVRALDAAWAQTSKQLVTADHVAFEADHAAEIAFSKEADRFELTNNLRIITLGVVSWIVLIVLSWIVSSLISGTTDQYKLFFLVVVSLPLLAALCIYQLLR
jgi:hypothetical protein